VCVGEIGAFQVATGLDVIVPDPTERNPSRTVPLKDYLRRVKPQPNFTTLSASWTRSTRGDVLSRLVDIGLECCHDDPDDRPELGTVRQDLESLLADVSAKCSGEDTEDSMVRRRKRSSLGAQR
jgi:hypothetical protein